MKHMLKSLLLMPMLLIGMHSLAQAPFQKGVNLTNWFQTSNARQIQFTKYTRKDFAQIKSLGCDVVRLPINLHFMTNGAPSYTMDPLFFEFLDKVVDWCEELDIKILLDNHTFDPATSTDANVGKVLVKVWKQMAVHYESRSKNVFYEILNEPHGISESTWGAIENEVIDTIRTVDTKHTIVVGGANWNSYNSLATLPSFTDTNLLYTFHFYDPFLFTHQGADWTDPKLTPLAGVPFPYNADSMPECPAALKTTWVKQGLVDYAKQGNESNIKSLLSKAVTFKNSRKANVFCGEFGVYNIHSRNSDRVAWYEIVRKYLEENGIPWTIWDYQGAFGLFEKGTTQMFDYDLNVPMLEALGMHVPNQQTYMMQPDTTGFEIFSDFIGSQLFESSNAGTGTIDFYNTQNPDNGQFCTYWKVGAQYTSIAFALTPNKDMSELADSGYALDFKVRGLAKGSKLDFRFIDSKTADPKDHPWRNRYTLTDANVSWDGYWHHLHIPLTQFKEHGSWDAAWFEPKGLFDWKTIDRFEISDEYTESVGKQFWFDDMYIAREDTAHIQDTSRFADTTKVAIRNDVQFNNGFIKAYPNPANGFVTIVYKLPATATSAVQLEVFDLFGKRVFTSYAPARVNQYTWKCKNDGGIPVQNGFYTIRVRAGQAVLMEKIVVQ